MFSWFWFLVGVVLGQVILAVVRKWPALDVKVADEYTVRPPVTYRDAAPCPHCGKSMLDVDTLAPRLGHSNRVPF